MRRERDQKRVGSSGGQSLAPGPLEKAKGPWQQSGSLLSDVGSVGAAPENRTYRSQLVDIQELRVVGLDEKAGC